MAIIKRRHRSKKQNRPTTFYQAEVFVQGVRVSTKTFQTKKEAVFWHEMERHKFQATISNVNKMITLKDCVDQFLKDAQTRMSFSSLQRYKWLSNYCYSSPLADVQMSELKGIHVVEWISWLKTSVTINKRRNSFRRELKFLNTILTWYKDFLNEDFNVPVTKKHKQLCALKVKKLRRPDYFIQPEDAKRWVEWLKENKGSNPVYWKLATFMLLTGARVGEACGLKWDAVDFKRNLVRIVRRVSWDYWNKAPTLEDVTKTAQSARILLLPKNLKDILLEMKKERLNDVVFTDQKGNLLKYNAIQSAFNHGFTALGLPWRSTHICRHTYATIALMTTKNLSAVQASLGHTEQRTTQQYAKTVALLSSDVAEQTASAIFKDSRK
ncbi:MAG: site-specific integrase [Bdellovibrionales bacterium]|nr:site-specific integrase [Bdellovibrionales bacterium]